jgi:hypothetical protein
MVVIDATILLLMLRPGTPVPAAPDGTQIEKPKERINFLVKELEKQKTKIIIPTPALHTGLVLLQYGNDLLFGMPLALHRLVLS